MDDAELYGLLVKELGFPKKLPDLQHAFLIDAVRSVQRPDFKQISLVLSNLIGRGLLTDPDIGTLTKYMYGGLVTATLYESAISKLARMVPVVETQRTKIGDLRYEVAWREETLKMLLDYIRQLPSG